MRRTSDELALFGGRPVVAEPFGPYNSMGAAELAAVTRVIRGGVLSGFVGMPGPGFLGGPDVREFERLWAERFGVTHAVSMNSATSGLIAALGAARVGPGDEVILPPFTMSATAMAPLVYGGIPVFADIEPDHFCIDVDAVVAAVTPRTRAIIAVNLFGHPAQLAALRALADERGIVLIEDNAQAPLANENGRPCGTIGHIGVFSLNFHKHVHTGEGGMCVTDDPDLAGRLQLIRNHGENGVADLDREHLANLFGFNFRMTELSAAVGIEQLHRLEVRVRERVDVAETLTVAVSGLEGFTAPMVRPGCSHAYYLWALRYDAQQIGISRERFSAALAAEGIPHGLGYVRPLYMLPLFQHRIAAGSDGYPFSLGSPRYELGMCPVAERMHDRELVLLEVCSYELAGGFGDLAAAAITKVHAARSRLRAG